MPIQCHGCVHQERNISKTAPFGCVKKVPVIRVRGQTADCVYSYHCPRDFFFCCTSVVLLTLVLALDLLWVTSYERVPKALRQPCFEMLYA